MELGFSTIGRRLDPTKFADLGRRVEAAGHVAEQPATRRDGPITTLIVEPTRSGAIEPITEIWSSL